MSENTTDLLCDINYNGPQYNGKTSYFKLNLDTTKVSGSGFTVSAQVSSTGDEKNDSDNRVVDSIALAEFSDIEISG